MQNAIANHLQRSNILLIVDDVPYDDHSGMQACSPRRFLWHMQRPLAILAGSSLLEMLSAHRREEILYKGQLCGTDNDATWRPCSVRMQLSTLQCSICPPPFR